MTYKAMASINAAILFAIVASPATYGLTQKLLGGLFKVASNGTPTVAGLLLHAAVYGLLAYAIMWLHRPKSGCGCGSCQYRQPWFKSYDLEDDMEHMPEDQYEDEQYEDDMEDDMEDADAEDDASDAEDDDAEDATNDMEDAEEYQSYEDGNHRGWHFKEHVEYAPAM